MRRLHCEQLQIHSSFRPERLVRFCYRPFDSRWVYWEPETKLLDERRAEYVPHVFPGNLWLEARQRQPKDAFDRGLPVRVLADNLGNGLSSFFPLFVRSGAQDGRLHATADAFEQVPNLSNAAAEYLGGLGAGATDLFHHVLAVLHSPAYRLDHGGPLRLDWPRVPLPAAADSLMSSAELGRMLVPLFDPDRSVRGVSQGAVRQELALLAIPAADNHGGPGTMDWTVNAGWGRVGGGGACMPGPGRVVRRAYTSAERSAIEIGASGLGLSTQEALALLGETTTDIYLNSVAAWRNVPERVWSYTLGGYQVLKKWLSYREKAVFGRELQPKEGEHFSDTARRIAAILLLSPRLDDNYRSITRSAAPFTPADQTRCRSASVQGETGVLL